MTANRGLVGPFIEGMAVITVYVLRRRPADFERVNLKTGAKNFHIVSSSGVITRDSSVLGGAPIFPGTSVPLRWLFDYLEAGQTLDKFLDAYPTVCRAAAVHALEHAKSLVLVATTTEDDVPEAGLGTELSALFPKHGLDFTIPELRFTMQSPFESSPKKAAVRPAGRRVPLSPQKPSRKSSSRRRKKPA